MLFVQKKKNDFGTTPESDGRKYLFSVISIKKIESKFDLSAVRKLFKLSQNLKLA